MATVHIICGSTGAGKTTYALELAANSRAVRFSIDSWMHGLFGPDQNELSFEWIMERIERCENQIAETAGQLLAMGIDIVLDLGFTLRTHRNQHRAWARSLNAQVVLHFVDVPVSERRARVQRRNAERDPRVYAFEVTTQMFDFMESRFERPDEVELAETLVVWQ